MPSSFERKSMTARLPLTAQNIATMVPTREDITFTHTIFAQCFFPLRRLKEGVKRYQVTHGRASLLVKAGDLLNPETGKIEEQDVPYGSASRLLLAHIHNHIIRAGSIDEAVHIPMGESLRSFFERYEKGWGGKNGNQIVRQVKNIASAHITLGVWTENQAKQINFPTLAEEINFWVVTDDQQRTLWQPSMMLNRRYVETIRERAVPLDMRTLMAMYAKPRAMDVFTWLSYRLPQIRDSRGVFVPFFGENGLYGIFGNGMENERMFKQEFLKLLKEVHAFYPEALIKPEEKGIRLFYSRSPIPPEHSIGQGKSLFFLG
jgi:hypothetical protein